MINIDDLEKILRRPIKDKKLFVTAFTHKSANAADNYERLEFVGDAVLSFVVSDFLFRKMNGGADKMRLEGGGAAEFLSKTGGDEGRMTDKRKALVCEETLAKAVKLCGLDAFLAAAKKTSVTDSMCADLFEAAAAACFYDSGLDAAYEFIYEYLIKPLYKESEKARKDYKSQLIEDLVKLRGEPPEYRTTETAGKRFVCEVVFNGGILGRGEGASKKEAERLAAKAALEKGDL